MTPINCEQARELVHRRLDGEAVDTAGLQEHLAACPNCGELAHDLAELDLDLRGVLSEAAAPHNAFGAVKAQATRAPGGPRRLGRPLAYVAVAAAAVVVVCILAARSGGPTAPVTVSEAAMPVHVFAPGSEVSHAVHAGQALEEDALLWGTDGAAISLEFGDGARLSLSGDAVARVGRREVTVCKGSVQADLTKARGPLTLATPWGTIEGLGAVFALVVEDSSGTARLSVSKGSVRVLLQDGSTTVTAGESVVLRRAADVSLAL